MAGIFEMSGPMMVVLIVAMVMLVRFQRHKLRLEERRLDRGGGEESIRLREEVRALRERLAVLERIATDDTNSLDRQIEALRDRPMERRLGNRDLDTEFRRDRADSREG